MNPVLRKELLQTFRLRRVAAVQFLFVLTLGLGVLMSWPQHGIVPVANRAQDELLDILVIAQLVLLLLFVPGMAAVSLSTEYETNTFEMLYASRLSPAKILSGKVFGSIAFPLVLLISGLPFVGLLAYRGSAAIQNLLVSYLLLLVTAALLSAIGLTVSCFCRQASSALTITYVVVLLLCGVPLVPAAILLDSASGLIAAVLHYGRSLSPVAAAMALLRPGAGDFDGRIHSFQSLWPVFVVASLVVCAICAIVLAFRLSSPRWEPKRSARAPRSTSRPLWHRLLVLIDPHARRRQIAFSNPLLANEGRINPLRSGRWGIRIFYASVVSSMALALISLYGGTEDPGLLNYVTRIVVAFQMTVIALIAPALTSAAISSEAESGTLELLRMTPLRSGQIFFGKLIPSLLPALLPMIALLPAYATICYLDRGYIVYFARLFPVVILATAFCCTAGLACSSWTANSARATVAAYVVTASLFLLPLLAAWSAGRSLSPSAAEWLAMPSPIAVALDLVNRGMGQSVGAGVWSAHLILSGSLVLLLLLMTRVRLSVLLKHG